MSDIFGGEEIEVEQQAVEVEQTPEPTPDPVAEVKKEPIGEQSTVPLSALNESRAQLRQTQAQLAEMQQRMGDMEKLRQEIEEFRAKQQQAREQQEFNTDPLGVIQKQINELKSTVTTQSQSAQQREQQAQSEQQMFTAIASQVNEFKKATPDYDDALAHVLEARKQELIAMGAPEYEAQNRVAMEAQEIAVNALRSGQNPGQVVYQLAKLRGYGAKQTAAKLATIEKGQQAASSLASVAGVGEGPGVSLAEIDSMSEDEFDKFWSKFEKNQRGNSR